MQTFLTACACITGAAAVFGILFKLFRMLRQITAGQKCILRKQMLDTYYKCKENGKIRQYRYEAFMLSYQAYKALGGNSFIDHIKDEVEEFEVIS